MLAGAAQYAFMATSWSGKDQRSASYTVPCERYLGQRAWAVAARILEDQRTQIGCGGAHGFCMRRAAWSAELGRDKRVARQDQMARVSAAATKSACYAAGEWRYYPAPGSPPACGETCGARHLLGLVAGAFLMLAGAAQYAFMATSWSGKDQRSASYTVPCERYLGQRAWAVAARILEDQRTQIGCGGAHGFCMRRAAWSAELGRDKRVARQDQMARVSAAATKSACYAAGEWRYYPAPGSPPACGRDVRRSSSSWVGGGRLLDAGRSRTIRIHGDLLVW